MCDLQKFVDDLKEAILNFRLDLCCFVFSVRAGILLCGYFNVISSMICLIAVSTGVLPPLLMNAQQSFMDGEYVKSTCAFAYSSDICLAVLLLCAMYRKDLVLLRYYTYCGLAMLASTLLVYSMVIGILSVLHTFLLVVSLTYQVYVILLVRSVMVELKHESEKLDNYYPNHTIYWRLNDIEAANHRPIETYEMREIVSNKNTTDVTPAITILPKRRASEPMNTTVPITTKSVKDIIESKTTESTVVNTQPTTSKSVDDTTKPKATTTVIAATASQPVKDTVQPTSSKTVKENTETKASAQVEDNAQSTTNETVKVAAKPKALRYPYKFIAIKIPKEETIKEEKENEEKETGGDVTDKKLETTEDSKEETNVTKEVRKKKRSIFGRKIKSKPEDDKTKDSVQKN